MQFIMTHQASALRHRSKPLLNHRNPNQGERPDHIRTRRDSSPPSLWSKAAGDVESSSILANQLKVNELRWFRKVLLGPSLLHSLLRPWGRVPCTDGVHDLPLRPNPLISGFQRNPK